MKRQVGSDARIIRGSIQEMERFLGEKNESREYIHKRLRQAYRSLKNNLKYLYTYEFLKEKIQIPTTTNSLESVFGYLKQKIGIHRGLKKRRKLRLIDDFLSKYPPKILIIPKTTLRKPQCG